MKHSPADHDRSGGGAIRCVGVFAAALLVCGLGGCAPKVTFEPQVAHDTLRTMEFLHALRQQPMVTYEQACRLAILLADGEDRAMTHEERTAELESRGIVRSEWGLEAKHAVDRGTIGYMIFEAAQVPGGLNTLLSGWTGVGDRRYAMKAVMAGKIMPYGLAYQIPTGGEVADAIAKADDSMAKRGLYESQEKLITSPRDIE